MKKRSTVLLAGVLSIGCLGNPAVKMEETVLAATKYEDLGINVDELPGLPKGINTPNLNNTFNTINDYEYYITDEKYIARKKTDGSEDIVIYQETPCEKIWAMEEGVLFLSCNTLGLCDHDGGNVRIIDEEIPDDYCDQSGYGFVIENDYIRSYAPYSEDIVYYSRDTLEKVEIADFLPDAEILLIDDKVYYYGEDRENEEEIVYCCNLDGSENTPLMLLPYQIGANVKEFSATVVDGDLYITGYCDKKLYKIPAGTSVATEEMYINDSESTEITGYRVRDNVIYCTDGSSSGNYFKTDMDGNYLGSCSKEEWDAARGRY